MRHPVFCIVVLLLISCSSTRYTAGTFSDKSFKWYESSMVGKSIIKFTSDSTFIYSERDSLFVCTGIWRLTDDKKSIIIIGKDIPLKNNLNPPIDIKLDQTFTIINQSKIKDQDLRIYHITRKIK